MPAGRFPALENVVGRRQPITDDHVAAEVPEVYSVWPDAGAIPVECAAEALSDPEGVPLPEVAERPAVLLLDEPLGSLDAKLRKQLQVELKALQEQVGITFLFVTHDQEEALSMSDRIAVMQAGRVEQVGTPRTLYEEPATPFVANFLGVSNLMTVDVEDFGADGCRLRIGEFRLLAREGHGPARSVATIVVRPERIVLEPYDALGGENRLPAMVERTIYVGSAIHVIVRLAMGATLQASMPNTGDTVNWQQGTPVCVHLPADAIRVLAVPGRRIALEDHVAPPHPGAQLGDESR